MAVGGDVDDPVEAAGEDGDLGGRAAQQRHLRPDLHRDRDVGRAEVLLVDGVLVGDLEHDRGRTDVAAGGLQGQRAVVVERDGEALGRRRAHRGGGGHRHDPASRRLHVVVERDGAAGVLVELDQRAGHHERRSVGPGGHLDQGHRPGAVLVLDDVGHGVRVVEDPHPHPTVLDRGGGVEHLDELQGGGVGVDVGVVGERVDDGRGLARLGLGDVVAGHRGVDVSLDRAHQDRRTGGVEQAVADAVDELVEPSGVGGHLGGDRVVVVDGPQAGGGRVAPGADLEVDDVAAGDEVVLQRLDGDRLARRREDLVGDRHRWLRVAGGHHTDPHERPARRAEAVLHLVADHLGARRQRERLVPDRRGPDGDHPAVGEVDGPTLGPDDAGDRDAVAVGVDAEGRHRHRQRVTRGHRGREAAGHR